MDVMQLFDASRGKEEAFTWVIDFCKGMKSNERLTVFDFGESHGLTLYITNAKTGKGFVAISSCCNGKIVSNAGSVCVDGALYEELARIWGRSTQTASVCL